jgi:hypothetical protein
MSAHNRNHGLARSGRSLREVTLAEIVYNLPVMP